MLGDKSMAVLGLERAAGEKPLIPPNGVVPMAPICTSGMPGVAGTEATERVESGVEACVCGAKALDRPPNVFGVVVGWVRRCLRTWDPADCRLLLGPYLVNMCFVLLVGDSDNLVFFVITNGAIPILVLGLSSTGQIVGRGRGRPNPLCGSSRGRLAAARSAAHSAWEPWSCGRGAEPHGRDAGHGTSGTERSDGGG